MTTDLVAQNKASVRSFFQEVWNDGDEAAIDRNLAPDTVGNDPDFGTGKEAFRAQWRHWQAAFADLHFEVIDLVAEGDKVVSRWVLTGTHRAEFQGIPATGKTIRVEGMSLDTLRHGQIVEGCDDWDALGLHRQLGAMP